MIFLGLVCGAWAHASGAPPIEYRILSFLNSSLWEATQTRLVPVEGGRYRTQEIGTYRYSGDCGDILANFQRNPLQVMVDRGYITSAMRDDIMRLVELGIRPQQFVLIAQYSNMPRVQAEQLFGGQIPEERSQSGSVGGSGARGPHEDIVSIARGTAMFVRGYEPVLDSRQKMTLRPLLLPWELDATLPSKLTRKMDRTRVPAMIEIGRAFSESGVLPGNLRQSIHVLLNYLATESRALKIDPSDLVLTSHFLDSKHSRLFSSVFPVWPMSPHLQEAMEADLRPALADAFAQPLPVGEQWHDYENALMVSTLARGLEKFPIDGISQLAHNMALDTQGAVKDGAAIDFKNQVLPLMRQSYDFEHPDFVKSDYPVVMRDYGSALLGARMKMVLQKIGRYQNDQQAEKYVDRLELNQEDPDSASDGFVDRALMHVPMRLSEQTPGQKTMDPIKAPTVGNLDPRIVERYPMNYLAAVLISAADLLRARVESLSPELYKNTLENINEYRVSLGRPALQSFDYAVFMQHYPLILTSDYESVLYQAKMMGGRAVPGLSLILDAKAGPITDGKMKIGMQQVQTTYYAFNGKAIELLRNQFPQYAVNARSHLQPGLWAYKLRMALAGVF